MARYDQEDNHDDLLGNMIVLGVSLVVIAAVVIGVVAGIDNPKDDPRTAHNMTLDAICNKTDYKETCMSSLEPLGNQTEVIVYFQSAVNATVSEMAQAMKKAKVDGDSLSDEDQIMALEDCIELMELCIEEMQSVIKMVNAAPNLFYNDSGDARSSLSAVISYQTTCLEGFKETHSAYHMGQVLQKSTELASNALAIIYSYSENDDEKAESAATPRRSTYEEGVEDERFPVRFSVADRKLLQSHKKGGPRPDAVVAKDGSGQYKTITAALNAFPIDHKGRYLIYVKSGVYKENIIVAKNMPQIYMYGDGASESIIAGTDINGTRYRRATLSAIGSGFICKDIGIRSPDETGGNFIAAVKLQSDNAAFFDCRINGTTSGIFALAHRQFFRECEIYGATNIISGDAALVIQRSTIILTDSSLQGMAKVVASQARTDRRESTGFVIHGCTIGRDISYSLEGQKTTTYHTAERLQVATYLAMAAEKYSRTIVMESVLGDLIHPDGWYNDMDDNNGIETVTFVEYGNKGPGAQTNRRVNWPGYNVITDRDDALRYTAGRFIQAQEWLPDTEVPFQAGLFS